jgi:hypothetical protein
MRHDVEGVPTGLNFKERTMLKTMSLAMIIAITILVWAGEVQTLMEEAIEAHAMSDRLWEHSIEEE